MGAKGQVEANVGANRVETQRGRGKNRTTEKSRRPRKRSWIAAEEVGVEIPHCKERGEWAELCFMERAAMHGLRVSKPHGESAPYDVVVEWEGRFRRVQVKSTIYRRRGESYSLNVMGPGRKAYRRGVVDFVAVYLIPIDRWYIIPYEALGESKCSVHFKPGGIRQKYEEYREGWERLKC
jgi:hypothetical protein